MKAVVLVMVGCSRCRKRYLHCRWALLRCSCAHYKGVLLQATRRRQSLHDSAAPSVTAEEVPLSLAGSSLPSTQTTCTVSLPSSSRPSGAQKDSMSPRKLALPFGGKRRPLQAVPTFDLVASAGAPATKDPLQHFPLPERSGLFADMLGSLEVNSEGDTASPKLMVSRARLFKAKQNARRLCV